MTVLPVFYDPSMCVTYIVYNEGCEDAIVIDPGQPADAVLKTLKGINLLCKAVLLTHGHYDHISGLDGLVGKTNAKVYIHEKDADMPFDGLKNVSSLFYDKPTVTHFSDFNVFYGGEEYRISGMSFRIIHTPGHTPGSSGFWFYGSDVYFSGDTLFLQSVGRWDFYGGNKDTILNSINALLQKLPDETVVFSGHGPNTSIKAEKDYNPFLR